MVKRTILIDIDLSDTSRRINPSYVVGQGLSILQLYSKCSAVDLIHHVIRGVGRWREMKHTEINQFELLQGEITLLRSCGFAESGRYSTVERRPL